MVTTLSRWAWYCAGSLNDMTGQKPTTAWRAVVWSAGTVTTGLTPPPVVRRAQSPSPETGISSLVPALVCQTPVKTAIGPAAAGETHPTSNATPSAAAAADFFPAIRDLPRAGWAPDS